MRPQIYSDFQENNFGTPAPPPLINFVHGYHVYHMGLIGHVAAAPSPLACPSRGAEAPKLILDPALGPVIVLT